MRTFFFNVGETTSMYANRPRSCRRNDFDVCESTCVRIDLYAKLGFQDKIFSKDTILFIPSKVLGDLKANKVK